MKTLSLLILAATGLFAQVQTGGGALMPQTIAVLNAANLGAISKILPGTTAVFEGDSHTAGFGLSHSADLTASCRTSLADATCQEWPSQLLLLPQLAGRITVKNNFAISGNNIAQAQAGYTASVHPLSPAVTGAPGILFFLAGANDIGAANPAAMETALTTYWAGAKADGWTLVAFTVIRRGDATGGAIGVDTTRGIVNGWIRQQWQAKVYDYLVDTDRISPLPYDPAIFQADLLHLNLGGHFLEAKAVNSILLNDAVFNLTGVDSVIGTGDANIRMNPMAMSKLTTGANNTAGGFQSLNANTTGGKNTFYGYFTGTAQVGLNNNVGIGWGALFTNTGGSDNVAIGQSAMVSGASYSQQVVIGSGAGTNGGGAGNVLIGYAVGATVSGNSNTCVGYTACASGDTMSGGNNAAIGSSARVTGAATGAVQLGAGSNPTSNTLQFQTVHLADNNGVTYLKTFTVATLPACGTTVPQGGAAFVTDATAPTYNLALTGGGAVVVPVFCDGTIWRSH